MIVVIPCWRRPAHLAALLRTIERARCADEQFYVFTVDHQPAPEIAEVIDGFALKRRVAATVYQGKHPGTGPAFNVLHGWRLGLTASSSNQLIGLLEEDLLVAEDIFEFWGDAMAADPSAVCVSACRNQNDEQQFMWDGDGPMGLADLAEGIYARRSYQSLAVAMDPHMVDCVLDYATDDYFEDPAGFIAQHLPADPGLPGGAVSQDALFHRVIRACGLHTLYPIMPRACHVGWYGYNRHEGTPLDPAAWRVDAERILTMPTDQMNELADPRFRDLERCDLIRPRVSLKLV